MLIVGKSISMIRGDTESFTVSMQDATGTAIPFVAGDILYFTLKTHTNTATKTLQKIITTFTDGKAELHLEHSDTASLAFGKYYYDIQVNRIVNNSVTTIIPPSVFTIAEEVTYD